MVFLRKVKIDKVLGGKEDFVLKKFMLILLAFIMALSHGALSYTYAAEEDHTVHQSELVKAKVLEVEYLEVDPDNPIFKESMMVKIEILQGEHKGQTFDVVHHITGTYGYDIYVEPGDKILATIEMSDEGNLEAYISEHLRSPYIYIVIGIFVALILIIGRMKGLKTVITLMLTILLVIKGLLPGLLAGYNPILLTILIAFVITLVTILAVSGINKKSFAAIIGILGGVFVAGLIAYLVGTEIKLTGLSSDEAVMLMYIPQGIAFDFRGLLFAGIIISAIGAIMDVGVSVASAMEEVRNVDPNISTKALIMSGMNVGKDAMGTMANTLILAYTGSSIPMLLLFTAYGEDFTKIINLDMIATEIIGALAGSIGLVLCIPLTAVAMGMLNEKGD
ncbi:YibE/F family protein [Alkaliphilus oremlandii OhILAs]|uniref:YibE/F family protein n=1 Tax=Alkaliphilus oremlandii (strain OhILAs) TaxID=350688 RepID=A8MIF6_ALKOO|nr:YibE/F family protein [Alkaliphilus oremlandii OhILAs]